MTFPNAKDAKDKAAKAAYDSLERRFQLGDAEQAALVQSIAKLHIVDKLVLPTAMQFNVLETARPAIRYYNPNPAAADAPWDTPQVHIHPNAFQQMCNVSKMPKLFVNELLHGEAWESKRDGYRLFEENMNKLFWKKRYLDRSKRPTKFLHRLVETNAGMEVRGFLSRNFNRHLASRPLLKGFIDACNEVGARPIEATTNDVFFNLKCFLPYVFEPVPGDFITFGVSWSNSDFGAGRMTVALCALRVIKGGPVVMDDALSRVHIGSIIQDSDLVISDDTHSKELMAQLGAIRDTVIEQLKPDSVDRMIKIIELAHTQRVPFSRIKSELANILQKGEFESLQKLINEPIEDLPPIWTDESGQKVPTRWWVSNAVSYLADKTVDTSRREELKEAAGNVLMKDASSIKPSS